MTYRTLFFNIMMTIFLCFNSSVLTAGMMGGGMDDFERELAEANKAIEEWLSSLPPAEQDAFNKQVEEFSEMFENMDEQEFEQFLGEMFADDPSMMMEQNPFDSVQPTAPEPVAEVVLSAEDKQKTETALAILDDIIAQSNVFMVIVNSSPELPNRINGWAQKGSLSNWGNEKTWDVFKRELESFIQKLYKAEEQDLTTKKYKYLLELIADEALYNNLIQLDTELKTLIPVVNLPEFGIQKLSTQSKEAVKNILSKYAESFYLLNIPQALDALFQKYAPEEEKIRLAEEAANKRTLELSRGQRNPAAATSAGVEGEMGGRYGDYYGGGYDPYGYSGYNDYGYDPYGYSGGYNDYDNSYGGNSGGGGGRSSGGGMGGGGGSSAGRSGSGIEKEEEEKEEKEEKDKKEKKSKGEKFVPNYDIELAIADFKGSFKDIKDALKEDEEGNPTKLATLEKHINEDTAVDVALVGSILPDIVDKKILAMNEDLKKINPKKLSAADLTHYQKEVNKFFDANKKTLEDLRKTIDKFERVTPEQRRMAELAGTNAEPRKKIDIEDVKTGLPKVTQWAYFGGEDDLLSADNEAEQKLIEDIGSKRVSLFDIKDHIDDLFDSVKDFAAQKAKPQAPKKETKPVIEDLDLE